MGMSTTPERLPSVGFLIWGIVPTVSAVSALSRNPLGLWSNALGAYALVWWIAAGYLRRGRPPRLAPVMLLIAVPWTAALAQSIGRLAFVVREGGLDRADGSGSPMAFVLGVVFEQCFVFIPLTVIALRLLRANRRLAARPTVASSASRRTLGAHS